MGWEDPLEEGMAAHSSILGYRIPWTEEPGQLQSMWLQRVRHNGSDLAHGHAPENLQMILNWMLQTEPQLLWDDSELDATDRAPTPLPGFQGISRGWI